MLHLCGFSASLSFSGSGAEPIRTDVKMLPLTFHDLHSDNIQLSSDRRRARRIETFCKGICFSARPIPANTSVHVRFAEVSTSWSGAIRFGFMLHDPATLNRETLPRYACPDLTNRPGYWAKALPERLARFGSVLSFRYSLSGDVLFAIDGEEKGVFFTGISTKSPLWALVDVYGNTSCVEFVGERSTSCVITQTHMHTSLMALCLGLPRWAGTRKVKPIWILPKQETVSGSGMSWAVCKSAPHSRHHPTSFLQAGCPSCHPADSIKTLKAIHALLKWPL